MKKITFKEFVNIINNATKKTEKTRFEIQEYDNNTFSIVEDDKDAVYLDVPEENKYDNIYETLKKEFDGRYEQVRSRDFSGMYKMYITIDDFKVIIEFCFKLTDGKNWLYLQYRK